MIKQIIIQLIKKHGILFVVEILKDFLLEYRQQSVMNEIKRSYEKENDFEQQQNQSKNDDINDILNKFLKN